MLTKIRRFLHGEPLMSDCRACGRRTFVCFHDERRCTKGHASFTGKPRITLVLGK